MAKKAAPRSKPAVKTAPAASDTAPAKPAARPRTAKRKTDKSVVSESVEATVVVVSDPSENEIRVRAYHRYLERGGRHGAEVDDWVEAERDLRQRR